MHAWSWRAWRCPARLYVHVRALACIEAAAPPQALADPEPDLVKALHYMHAGRLVSLRARAIPYQCKAFASLHMHACAHSHFLFCLLPSVSFVRKTYTSSLVGFMKAFQIVL
jgi:hypothetical protein